MTGAAYKFHPNKAKYQMACCVRGDAQATIHRFGNTTVTLTVCEDCYNTGLKKSQFYEFSSVLKIDNTLSGFDATVHTGTKQGQLKALDPFKWRIFCSFNVSSSERERHGCLGRGTVGKVGAETNKTKCGMHRHKLKWLNAKMYIKMTACLLQYPATKTIGQAWQEGTLVPIQGTM
ncbi:hypothetical protein EDD18DRAFT_1107795 [Armillaria luteobubalina]|uniref:Uncharacterized protein n=1 Tax=Armillaria luteobubalina TaxID=153913 RepID=A0AA39Q072_9AGAR|nr:hypothetical protein EDD18DRAFT_1107795 [Armillaria luteobubalina]